VLFSLCSRSEGRRTPRGNLEAEMCSESYACFKVNSLKALMSLLLKCKTLSLSGLEGALPDSARPGVSTQRGECLNNDGFNIGLARLDLVKKE